MAMLFPPSFYVYLFLSLFSLPAPEHPWPVGTHSPRAPSLNCDAAVAAAARCEVLMCFSLYFFLFFFLFWFFFFFMHSPIHNHSSFLLLQPETAP
jgi:hypothetical protein